MGADLVGLPQAGDFGKDQLFKAREVLLGHGDAIEGGKKLADAAALEHDGAARNFSRVRGKDGHNEHATKRVEGLVRGDAHAAHLDESSSERTALAACVTAELKRNATALAVIGLRKIDEFKVEGEGAGEQDGALDGQRVDQFESAGGVESGFLLEAAGLGVAAANGALAQRFNLGKELVASLLAEHVAEERSKRTHVAAERRFFQVAGLGFQLRQALLPVFGIPQECHRVLIMHERPGKPAVDTP